MLILSFQFSCKLKRKIIAETTFLESNNFVRPMIQLGMSIQEQLSS